ncbi:MAG: hypothetical protein WC453_03415 [Patescibacteria group bacterium]
MKTIKAFLFSEKKMAAAIFSFLAVAAFAFVFGPNIYAQFARQTGSTGWGYGYGYGYGYGGGFDGGTYAGYRTTGNANPTVYDYGYGYGYIASGVTYDATNGYEVTPASMASLVQSGVMVPNGANIANTTQVTFTDKVTMTVASGVTVTIPSGTTFTSGSAANFSQLAAANGASTTGLNNVTIAGSALSFGLPSLDLTVSPAITIALNVGASYNGQTLTLYRKDASGAWSYSGATCTVSGGICSFTTTHLSTFVAGTDTGSGNSASTAGGGGGVVSTPVCTEVTYGNYTATCFNGYQYREAVSRTPAGCALTAQQTDALRRVCSVTVTTDESSVVTSAPSSGDFVTMEKALVVKVNKALAKRLAGRILLQVQSHGEAWYMNPVDGLKYYLGTPADAFAMMRKMALGVSNKTFATFKNGKAPARLAGRILLKVEDKGMAYYVNPTDLKLYYLGRPADAFNVMRKLGLGVNNTNLRQLGVGTVK